MLEEGVLEQVDVEMQDIKLVGAPSNLLQHHKVRRDMIADPRKAQALRYAGNQPRRGLGVAARE
jgi:hypothetical protein